MTPVTAHKLIWDRVAGEDGLGDIALATNLILAGTSPFCLWLVGSVGAGKTRLSGAILHAMGLPSRVPVLSPTYTYLQEYALPDGRKMAHLDLYRATAIEALEDAGVFADLASYSGVLIEWPPMDAATRAAADNGFAPSHIMIISPVEGGSKRQYQLAVAR